MYDTAAYFVATVAWDFLSMRIAPTALFAGVTYSVMGLRPGSGRVLSFFSVLVLTNLAGTAMSMAVGQMTGLLPEFLQQHGLLSSQILSCSRALGVYSVSSACWCRRIWPPLPCAWLQGDGHTWATWSDVQANSGPAAKFPDCALLPWRGGADNSGLVLMRAKLTSSLAFAQAPLRHPRQLQTQRAALLCCWQRFLAAS